MKTLLWTLGTMIVLAALPLAAVPMSSSNGLAGSGDVFTLWFDENGHGRFSQNGGPVVGDAGVLMVDPISGLLALAYALPEPVNTGDVRVWEDANATILSDLMRFENIGPNGNGVMFYFSDPGDKDLADINGIPPLFNINDGGGIFELPFGNESVNGFDWFPGGNVYHGISDTPEPGSIMLFGSGALGLSVLLRRTMKR
jgi:hypothetical protein